ncbi:MAG: phosphotransferase, partial [Candidatus Diapherotrites archaeon]|nr:phosphotransferase [Candidatus Diapherotrites archaeon]
MKKLWPRPIAPQRLEDVSHQVHPVRRTYIERDPSPRFKYVFEPDIKRAQQINIGSKLLRRAGIPVQRVIAREGQWTIQRYIQGPTLQETLGAKPIPKKIWTQVAEQMARMHRIELPKRLGPKKQVSPQDELRKEIGGLLELLGKTHMLTPAQSERIHTYFLERIPTKVERVLSLRDIKKDHLIVRDGKISFIDIGGLGLEYPDKDLMYIMRKLGLRG